MIVTTKRAFSTLPTSEPKLYSKLVQFQTKRGRLVDLNAVYEDSSASGSPLGTVIGFHGTPGSHRDFKYVRQRLDSMNIRFIGINYPGFKQTPAYPGQHFGNWERNSYSEALLNELDVPGKVIIMGHSRGCENALITAANRKPHGLVMANPTGLRINKGSRPKGKLESLIYFHKKLPKKIGDAILYKLMKSVGFKIHDGEEAVAVIRAIMNCDLEKQLEYILKLNELPTKTMITFGGSDHLIEKEIVFEALKKYQGLAHFNFKANITDSEKQNIMESFKNQKGTSVFIAKDNHFQNKKRADLLADAARSMLLN